MDGRLPGLSVLGDPTVAQRELTRIIEDGTGRTVIADWTQDKPDWWPADARLEDA